MRFILDYLNGFVGFTRSSARISLKNMDLKITFKIKASIYGISSNVSTLDKDILNGLSSHYEIILSVCCSTVGDRWSKSLFATKI